MAERDGGMTPAAAVAASVMPQAGIARQGFSEQSLERSGSRGDAAQAAQARAMIEARFIMARRFPRSWDDVRVKLLAACNRPGFAGDNSGDREKNWGAAWYRKPVGQGVEGFSVRFAEEAARTMGNISIVPRVVYDDDLTRIVDLDVIDLESNTSVSASVTIEKTVERLSLKKGEVALRTRINSKQETLYILPATPDEVLAAQQREVAKARRTLVLQVLPGDIQAECRKVLLAIRFGAAATDPAGERKKIADGFAKLGVHPIDLEKYLEHPLGQCSPYELDHLRQLWEAIKDGKLTWVEVLASKEAEDVDESPTGEAEQAGGSGLDRLAEKLKQHQAEKKSKGAAAGKVAPELFVVEPSGADPDCPHPDVDEKRLTPEGIAPGEEIVCKHCKRTWRLRKDSDPKPSADKPRQGRLSDR